jgi:hypothetical protein
MCTCGPMEELPTTTVTRDQNYQIFLLFFDMILRLQ